MKHKQALSSITIGILAVVCLFLQIAPAQADRGKQQLRSWLRENRVVFRLVKIDGHEGFTYGLSITGQALPLIVIAPSRQRGWLVQVDGEEGLLQPDAAGSLALIADTDTIWVWVCYFKAITNYLTNAAACTTPLCFTDTFLTLLISMKSCQPVEPTYSISGGSSHGEDAVDARWPSNAIRWSIVMES